MNQSIAKKISLLNDMTLDSILEKDSGAIIKNFTEVGIKILEADFGFAWWKSVEDEEYKLVYKSSTTPYEPTLPRNNAGNYIARKTKKPFFDSEVKKENYLFDINKYLKSYTIIPIYYKEIMYGSLVLCFKRKHIFTEEDRGLSISLGQTTAQTITIHSFIEKEQVNRKKTEMLAVLARLLQEEKIKTEFIANATHEFRTPLAIIKGNVDLALQSNGQKQKSAKSALTAIDQEVKHLSDILSDLALMMATTKGGVENRIIFHKIDLGSLIGGVIKRCRVLAHKKNISITLKKMPPTTILSDKIYLEKMLINLIKNSITYGIKNGHTWIEVKKSKETVMINVSDNGIGISKEDMPHVFERFYRGDKAHSSNGHHIGLGLAIVKWIAEIHDGSVSVKKNKNKGSIFSVNLPLKEKNS